jgi:hypothetical protein
MNNEEGVDNDNIEIKIRTREVNSDHGSGFGRICTLPQISASRVSGCSHRLPGYAEDADHA